MGVLRPALCVRAAKVPFHMRTCWACAACPYVRAGKAPWELPEHLLGAFRMNHLDCAKASVQLDWSKELPLK